MNKLYYTVNIEEDDGLIAGMKSVSVYTIENNEPKIFTEIDVRYEDNSESEIQVYLDNNGYGDDKYELVRL